MIFDHFGLDVNLYQNYVCVALQAKITGKNYHCTTPLLNPPAQQHLVQEIYENDANCKH